MIAQTANEFGLPPTETSELLRHFENVFTYHASFGNQAVRYAAIRDKAKEFSVFLVEEVRCPLSQELKTALMNIEEVVFWANAAIARNEKPEIIE